MKLAKKMLACAMALAMVAALALTAFAAPTIKMNSASANVGEEVTIVVSGVDMAGFESGDLVFTFDTEALEFVSVKNLSSYEDAMGVGGLAKDDPSKATFSLILSETAEADSDLCKLTFKVLKAGASDVVMSVKSWDGTEDPASVKATVTGTEATTAAPTTIAPTTVAPTTAAPVEDESAPVSTTAADKIPQTGDVGVAAIAGVMALAAVAFVATRKKDAE